MEKQPHIYRVSPEIFEKALSCKWAMVLRWLQEKEGPQLLEGFTLRQAVESLLVWTAAME
jgi:hypothetical protein